MCGYTEANNRILKSSKQTKRKFVCDEFETVP